MGLIDSHCHLHDSEFYPEQREKLYQESRDAGVDAMIVVGTDARSSREAIEFAEAHAGCYAVVGIHPHEAKDGHVDDIRSLIPTSSKLVGIGEIGLDYYYEHSPRDVQAQMLEAQLQLALDHDLPISFHVRDAYDDFWPILDNFHSVRGVLHSFTDTPENAERGLSRGLFIGINGISTFTKDVGQRELYRTLPLDKIVLETDAPFLTPQPFRGKVNVPAYVKWVAEHQARERGVSFEVVCEATSQNAVELFHLPI